MFDFFSFTCVVVSFVRLVCENDFFLSLGWIPEVGPVPCLYPLKNEACVCRSLGIENTVSRTNRLQPDGQRTAGN
ncbi:MAG: hypothetical protein J3Q66DRAFT_353725 [Benniella sp.]|nr:MAG: hypothetical protein J3Q66DRAFT_353725 [Benniella sp.]